MTHEPGLPSEHLDNAEVVPDPERDRLAGVIRQTRAALHLVDALDAVLPGIPHRTPGRPDGHAGDVLGRLVETTRGHLSAIEAQAVLAYSARPVKIIVPTPTTTKETPNP